MSDSLKDRVMKAAEWDEPRTYDHAKVRRNRRSELMATGKLKSVPVNREAVYSFVDGAKNENARLRPLIEKLAVVAAKAEDAIKQIKDQRGLWPAEVDDLDDALKELLDER